ncbi:MAG: hypothetical protein NC548_36070 [Lachnospiraceae bacterium]|nr:hypothetical protein [Lachnospiraceae bacterium]
MVYHYDYKRPDDLSVVRNLGRKQVTVNFDIKELPEDDSTGYRYSWQSVTLAPGVWSYGAIVSAIVALEYNPNEIEAMTANLMSALAGILTEGLGKIAEYKDEFAAFTKWRLHAKEVAKAIIDKYPTP